MNTRPKYSIPEIERRWTVSRANLPDLTHVPKVTINDKYLTGSRLRLRAIYNGAGIQHKLGKKYGDRIGLSESITNIYLSPSEYAILNRADGLEVTKTRYRLKGGSLDIYPGDDRPILFSVEFRNEKDAINYEPPEFVQDEVTHDHNYTGFTLASGGA